MKRRLILLFVLLWLLPAMTSFAAAEPVPVSAITLSEEKIILPLGRKIGVRAVVEPKDADNRKVIWSSSDESVATVFLGYVTSVAPGTAEITATAADGSGVYGSMEVTVITPVSAIHFADTGTLCLAVSVPWRIAVQTEPENATITELAWSSENERIATVDAYGVVTGVSPGSTTIIARATDGGGAYQSIRVEVSRYDLIFLDQEPRSITYTVTKGYHRISGWVESGCVSMEALAYETVNEDEEYAVSVEITPEKPGADTVTITGSGKACRVTAYVSPDAYPDFHAAVGTDPDRTYEEIRVLDLPWDAAYPQVKGILEGEDLQIGDPVIKSDHIRAVISGEIPFGECTAAVVALDFSYTPGISNYRDNNALFRGVFYFAPDTSTDQIRLAVRNRYNLTNGDWWGNVWTWLRGDVLLTLSCTERYIVLEVEKLSEDMLW